MAYKALIIIPVLLLVVSVGLLVNGYLQTGEWFLRGIDMKGGTVISIPGADYHVLEEGMASSVIRVRSIGGFSGGSVLVEAEAGIDVDTLISSIEALGISTQGASIHTIGPVLGESFWAQARIGIVMAFVFMGLVVFFLFRKPVPSVAVIFAAASDIVVTLAFMQIFSIPLTLAGLAALLMLIGYSVDTDILLTTRVMKGDQVLNKRFTGALKTGLTMSLTTIGVLVTILLVGVSEVISQIAIVLLIGLVVDLVFTWFANAGLLRWYVERGGV